LSEDISEKLQRIEMKIDWLMRILEGRPSMVRDISVSPMKLEEGSSQPVDVNFLKLPDSLRQTVLAMERLKEATTIQVAAETGRSRSVESIHLNQLERMGYLQKFRSAKKIYFRFPSQPRR